MNEQQIKILREQGKTDEEIAILLGQAQQEQQQAMSYADPNAPQVAQQSQAPVDNAEAQVTEAPVQGDGSVQPEATTIGFTEDPRIADLGSDIKQMQGKRSKNDFSWGITPASDSEALGEALFAFGLRMLASSSRPGAEFGGSLAEGIAAGSERFFGAINRNKRYENIEKLQEMGYNDTSINDWLMGGDSKILSKEAPKLEVITANGVAYSYDPLSPNESLRELPGQRKGGVSAKDQPLKTAKLGDKLVQWDYTQNKWVTAPGTENMGNGTGTGSSALPAVSIDGVDYEEGVHPKLNDAGDVVGYVEVKPNNKGDKLTYSNLTKDQYDGKKAVDTFKEGNTLEDLGTRIPVFKTGDESKTFGLVQPAVHAAAEIDRILSSGKFDPASIKDAVVDGKIMPHLLKGAEAQRFGLAIQTIINMKLRRETGAAYTLQEFNDAWNEMGYRMGDKDETKEYKRGNMYNVIEGHAYGAGQDGARYLVGSIRKNRSNDPFKAAKKQADDKEAMKQDAIKAERNKRMYDRTTVRNGVTWGLLKGKPANQESSWKPID